MASVWLAPVRLEFKLSRGLLAAVFCLHGAAVLLLFLYASGLLLLSCLTVLMISFLLAIRDEYAKRKLTLLLEESGNIQLYDGEVVFTAIAGNSAVEFNWAVWLKIQSVTVAPRFWRHRYIMICRDNLQPETWRQLRIWLRYRAFSQAD